MNAIPVFIASDPEWAKRFEDAGVPIVGDDIKSQVGATIVHRILTRLFEDRGVSLDRTYQLNFGGNMDFKNMLERKRLKSKKISKTQSVTSQMDHPVEADEVHIGPSDHVPWLDDRKWAYIRLEGRNFGDVPLNMELELEVWDSPNSAGVIIDAVRCAKVALDRGIGGPLLGPSAYFMKSPPVQYTDEEVARWWRPSPRRVIAGMALEVGRVVPPVELESSTGAQIELGDFLQRTLLVGSRSGTTAESPASSTWSRSASSTSRSPRWAPRCSRWAPARGLAGRHADGREHRSSTAPVPLRRGPRPPRLRDTGVRTRASVAVAHTTPLAELPPSLPAGRPPGQGDRRRAPTPRGRRRRPRPRPALGSTGRRPWATTRRSGSCSRPSWPPRPTTRRDREAAPPTAPD